MGNVEKTKGIGKSKGSEEPYLYAYQPLNLDERLLKNQTSPLSSPKQLNIEEFSFSETNRLMADKIESYTQNSLHRTLVFQYYNKFFKKKRIIMKNLDKSTKFWTVTTEKKECDISELSAFITLNLQNCCSKNEYLIPIIDIFEDVNSSAVRIATYQLPKETLFNYINKIKSEDQIRRIIIKLLRIIEFLSLNGISDLDCLNFFNIYISDNYNCSAIDIGNFLQLNLFEALEEKESDITLIPPEKIMNDFCSETDLWCVRNRSIKTDLYRLGMIAFKLLFKSNPYEGIPKYSFVENVCKKDFTIDLSQFDTTGVSREGVDFILKLLCTFDYRLTLQKAKKHPWLGLCIDCSKEQFLMITKESTSFLSWLPLDVIDKILNILVFYEKPTEQLPDQMRELLAQIFSKMRNQIDVSCLT